MASSTNVNEVDAQQQIQDKFKKISKQFYHQTSSGENDKYMFNTLQCIFYISCQLGTHFHVMFYNIFPMFVDNLIKQRIFYVLHFNPNRTIDNAFSGIYHQLATMVQTFIGNKGGTKYFALSFILGGDYLTLRLIAYIKLLDNKKGFLSTYAMDFFRLWYLHTHLTYKATYITHPHYWDIVRNWTKHNGESKKNGLKFLKKIIHVPTNVNKVIVPL
jgi:hypothetical protein